MAALSINLVMEQGADFESSFTIQNRDGSPLNLLGYTGVCRMKKSYAASQSINLTLTFLNRTAGVVGISYNASQTSAVKPRRYVYDILLTSINGLKTRVIEGIIEVKPGAS
jgi:hypothetical protein